MLAIARMLLNYLAVLSGVGNFKASSLQMLRTVFQYSSTITGTGWLMPDFVVVDCAFEWSFHQRFVAGVVAPLVMMLTLIAVILLWRSR